jgi:hypothetical protein
VRRVLRKCSGWLARGARTVELWKDVQRLSHSSRREVEGVAFLLRDIGPGEHQVAALGKAGTPSGNRTQ